MAIHSAGADVFARLASWLWATRICRIFGRQCDVAIRRDDESHSESYVISSPAPESWVRSVSLVSSVPFNPLVRSRYYGWHDLGHIVALHEHATLDLRSDRPMYPSFGEYDVPVNTDVSSLAAILSDEHDPNLLASRVAVKS